MIIRSLTSNQVMMIWLFGTSYKIVFSMLISTRRGLKEQTTDSFRLPSWDHYSDR
jgi:hypothetical protein